MIVTRSLAPYVVLTEDSILAALNRISENQSHLVFCVAPDGRLEAVFTDGDFRRWVVRAPRVDLTIPVGSIANREFVSCPEGAATDEIAALIDDKVTHVPLVDRRGRLVAIASRDPRALRVGERTIGEGSPTLVIAEIGINHNGSVERALALVDAAAQAGADCAKFQLRDIDAVYRGAAGAEDVGAEYTRDLVTRFQLSHDDLFRAFDRCVERGLLPLCTPWDGRSVEALEGYGIAAYKIASADLTNHSLLRTVARTGRPVVVSTGMSVESEIQEAVAVLRSEGAGFALLHANSTYPAPFKDVNLRYLDRLRQIGSCPVGYSGHERGYNVAVAAVALGADVVEKHFTLDRGLEGNDHKVSLLPEEFAAMVEAIRQIEDALGSPRDRRISPGEMMNRVALAKSVVAARDITKGEPIDESMLATKSPGRGLQPNRLHELLGLPSPRDVAAGEFFYPSDVGERAIAPRRYSFSRPWGVPVRYHDVKRLYQLGRPDFVEFHLTSNDMDIDPAAVFGEPLDCGVVVHSPDLFAADHLLNLAADDDDYRKRSVAELQRVVDVTRALVPWFRVERPPLVVASLGGFTTDAPIAAAARHDLYERVAASLAEIDEEGVEIVAQTLPPFPWYLGGQLFCNLFVDAEDTAAFAARHARRLCLDVSHSKLAATHRRRSFNDVVDVLGPYAAHLHIVDAEGVDGEGVQIGDGDIDFADLAERLRQHAPTAGFIPEIWQGHQNDGEGFWIALDRLERWF